MNYVLGYILLIAYLFGFIIGFSTILFSIIYYIIERVAWLKYYIVFLFTFAFLLLIRAIKLLSFLTIPYFMSNNIFNTLYFFSFSVAMSLMLYFIPAFLYRFLNINWNFKQNIVYISLSIIHFILSILGILITFDIYIISSIIFYISIIVIFVIGAINYKSIKDKTMKLIVKILGLITIIIYPVLMYQLILYRMEVADIGFMDITLLLFYIWWNLVMLGYLSWYFINIVNNKMSNTSNMKNNMIDNSKIENESGKEIDINLTRREKEILSYLLDGKTNKEVSLILSISLNTVNNHVANIYEKSGVKNRVELVNKFSKN
ncbi:helix-turn-helix transcriptional regulator [Brachyspira hyodysenteriae]|uniref:helix-turn-helix domain-containing protein n=1 Tax=Brachyspira hyodysenteriae TaxID=159 RepID=UPI0022CDB4B5|nr:helix-turn-helix transcriptional regulator [Brachyspira hyodysenteriae]MCZ9838304.1 helix-turn-helix transcriptional regulator [Brachyspira hyodysenteriae]MCZ9849414.1 helix-turn-helix transcriptional regulator [Brachyspira hyodysenteriae]MCZ9850297.1 helix-turn-helix transcriptional regulator [Brachyspira hyodysenteriae]MCZ9860950.1 helix-turn-helix transcriptional regulator [Brachyspira hyodysenteriae]MCZ9870783.1 helix-turn-helix transcriptional regulator [Brachyspira hyodysenteriae]